MPLTSYVDRKLWHYSWYIIRWDIMVPNLASLATPEVFIKTTSVAASDVKLTSWQLCGWQPPVPPVMNNLVFDSSLVSVCNNYFCKNCCNWNHPGHPFICFANAKISLTTLGHLPSNLSFNLMCYITYIQSMWRYVFASRMSGGVI